VHQPYLKEEGPRLSEMAIGSGFGKGWQPFVDHNWNKKALGSALAVDFVRIIENMVARDGVEPPTPAFSELYFPVYTTTSMVAVGLPNTGKYGQGAKIMGDCRG
jgi:hypothetical protein